MKGLNSCRPDDIVMISDVDEIPKSCQITDLSSRPQYELITMNSSFEHMNNPREVLSKVKELLSNNGLCLIKIPLMGLAFELYHENWYQIDAPRHYYLYTVKAMRILCEEVGLEIKSIMYDSTGGQFYISEEYRETDLDLQEIISRYQGEKRSVKNISKEWLKKQIVISLGIWLGFILDIHPHPSGDK